jgi:hypothetical protein
MNWKYWLWLVATFTCAVGWHEVRHMGHPFWGGVLMGLSWGCGKEALKNDKS